MKAAKILINVRLSAEHRTKLDAWAKAHSVNRTEFIEMLIESFPDAPLVITRPENGMKSYWNGKYVRAE